MEWICLVLVSCYIVYFLLLLVNWEKIADISPDTEETLRFTVIIPVRNEETNILHLLRDLEQQDYPPDHFEVLVVDDYSTDQTATLVKAHRHTTSLQLFLLEKEPGQPGKKQSITRGVNQARFPLIICLDGDCRVDNQWLTEYNRAYVNTRAEMVLAPVTYNPVNNWFESMQHVEFSALVGLGASSLQMDLPNFCSGANMSFRKSLFREVNGYDGNQFIPSGDDEFLLQKAFDHHREAIHFNKSFQAVCTTTAKTNLKSYHQQRKRWSSRWKFHTRGRVKLFGIGIFVASLAQIGLLLSLLFTDQPELLLTVLFLRFLVEFLFVYRVNADLNREISLPHSIILHLVYPFYIIFLSVSSQFGGYRWKDRQYL